MESIGKHYSEVTLQYRTEQPVLLKTLCYAYISALDWCHCLQFNELNYAILQSRNVIFCMILLPFC